MNRIITFLAVLIFSAGSSYAQDTTADDLSGWANEWKHAFSKEGVKEWKPEFTLRYYTGLTTTGPMLTGGVKVDEKRTFALFLGQKQNCSLQNHSSGLLLQQGQPMLISDHRVK